MYLNLVLEYIPETVYKVSRHYNRSKQTIPISFIKVRRRKRELASGFLSLAGLVASVRTSRVADTGWLTTNGARETLLELWARSAVFLHALTHQNCDLWDAMPAHCPGFEAGCGFTTMGCVST